SCTVRLAVEFVRPGKVVWDIGANSGIFAFAAANLTGSSGSVVAFEPDTWLVQLLRRSARIQRDAGPVQVVAAAVAKDCDLRTFNIAQRSRAANFLDGYDTVARSRQTGGVAERHTVVTLTLDWLAERLPAPDVIKIDVEGAELEVLQGGERL